MSGDEPFLARWWRRKLNAATWSDVETNLPPSAAELAKPVSSDAGEAITATPLPPIEAIESTSDIKAFLAPGAPLELTRAALRRAWTADPAIRDFIGLSENAWDFNAPGGVPGFGSLDLEDIRGFVGQVLGESQEAAASSADGVLADQVVTPFEGTSTLPIAEPRESIAATQHQSEESNARNCRPRHHHGGALPR
ncbi:MAG TPA: DUF3306 domain-containing protein [Stellaceae bacterium]|jgi:hypothetical protein|nr:DUF3306 domain-containing protein [Stellaceae bacterium]